MISSRIGIGDTKRVKPEPIFRRTGGDIRYTLSERLALLMHTHGIIDTPPSPTDFMPLINEGKFSHEAGFVFTKTKKYLLMRSLETPEMKSDQALKEIEEYDERYKEEVMRLNQSNQNVFYSEQVRLIEKTFLDMCRKYKIVYYLATDGHEYHRVDNAE